MRKATRLVSIAFGITAAIAGFEHGYFEILQGNTRPEGIVIESIGPPCIAEEIWNNCEPAMTIIPNFLISGILTVIISLVILVWSTAFLRRKSGGIVLLLLNLALLLFGGGFFPPIIGFAGGVAALTINRPLPDKKPGAILHFGAHIWPWPPIIFLVWTLGQFPVGYFFNDFMQSIMVFSVILILTTIGLSVFSGYAHDRLMVWEGSGNET